MLARDDLDRHIDAVDRDRIVAAVDPTDERQARTHLDTYLSEAAVAFDLVAPHLRPGMRVLEVGSGIGVFASFLWAQGVDITAVEPFADDAFAFIHAAGATILEGSGLPVLTTSCEALTPETHGRFDLVFSVNVLEHLPDVGAGLDALTAITALQVHTCPNYTVPYEPHFGLPLVPFRPAATRRLWARRVADTGLWRSLNWVTAGQVRQWARSRGRTVTFEPGQMVKAIDRIGTDDVFATRHTSPLLRLAASRPVHSVATRLPATWSTPMTFTIR